MLFEINNEKDKGKLNKTIQTLVQSKFIVKMLPAIENTKTMFYLVLDLEIEDLEYEAEC